MWDGLFSVLILTSQKYGIIFQIDVDGPEDTSLDEILSVMDEIQKELMDEGQNSWEIDHSKLLHIESYVYHVTCISYILPSCLWLL